MKRAVARSRTERLTTEEMSTPASRKTASSHECSRAMSPLLRTSWCIDATITMRTVASDERLMSVW